MAFKISSVNDLPNIYLHAILIKLAPDELIIIATRITENDIIPTSPWDEVTFAVFFFAGQDKLL